MALLPRWCLVTNMRRTFRRWSTWEHRFQMVMIIMISRGLRWQQLKATMPRAPLQAWTSSQRANAQLGSTILRVTTEPVVAGQCHHYSHHIAVTVIIVIIIVINLILRQMSDKGTWLLLQVVLMLIIITVTILEIYIWWRLIAANNLLKSSSGWWVEAFSWDDDNVLFVDWKYFQNGD